MKGDRIAFKVDVDVDDTTGKARAVYFHIRTGSVDQTREVKSGVAFADYSHDGLLIGVELLAPCQVDILDQVTKDEPQNVRQFLKSNAPRELVCN